MVHELFMMENFNNLALRVLRDREYFQEISEILVFTKVSIDCKENTFHKYVVVRTDQNQVFSKRGVGRIGMTPFTDEHEPQLHNSPEQFGQSIGAYMRNRDFHLVNIQFGNAKHLVLNRPASSLPEPIYALLMRLLDEYMPTGILSIDEVLIAEDILHKIKQNLEVNIPVENNLSEQFYEIIPQNGSLNRLETINNRRLYRNKIEVLNQLRSALDSLYDALQRNINPIDHFRRYWLRTEFSKVDPTEREFPRISRCTRKTQHPDPFYTLTNAFKVTSSADIEFESNMKNQYLLYHFTFPCNILGILRDGLQVAPRHIYSQNRFLGKGIYFWDSASMALSAFDGLPEEMSPILLVCRVALGNMQRIDHQYLERDEMLILQNGNNSFFCRGIEFEHVNPAAVEFDSAKMYSGQIAESSVIPHFGNYNKYMVQDQKQVKVEYILQFKKMLADSEQIF